MATSPLLGFDEMAVAQANKYLTFNEFAKLMESISWRVLSRTTAAQPGSPSDGDSYILPSSPTGSSWGSWSQHDLVTYRGTEWVRITPFEGLGPLWVNADDERVTYDGSSWVTDASTHSHSSISNGTSNVNIASSGGDITVTRGGTSVVTVGAGTLTHTVSATTGVGPLHHTITVPNTLGNRGGYSVIHNNGGSLAGWAAEIVTAGAYPNAVGQFDIWAQNGASTQYVATFKNTGDVDLLNGGISLSGGTDYLDTYEEDIALTVTVADAASGGNVAGGGTTVNRAVATRTGNEVIAEIDVSAIDTTGLTAGNVLYVRGLPYASAAAVSGSVRVDNIAFTGSLTVETTAAGTTLKIVDSNSGAGATSLLVSALTSTTAAIKLVIKYLV